MSFIRYNEDGTPRRNRVTLDTSNDETLVEQNHKEFVNINNIIKRHGMDMIAQTAKLSTPEYLMDDIPTNDFMESMLIVTKAQESFEKLPSDVRYQFHNNPAEFLDFIHNPDNQDKMVEMGLAQRKPKDQPVQVQVMNQTQEAADKPPVTEEKTT